MNATTLRSHMPTLAADYAESTVVAIPWYVWTCVIATACIGSGLYWDISWHLTIGRDTFWTPAHLLIQFGAVLAGLSSAYLIFRTTLFGDATAKEGSVRVLGFYGPLGAFICAWGAGAMLISAPFDDWWHNAYGLDVKIISPPHQLLGLGIEGISFGAVILIAGAMNRSYGAIRDRLSHLMVFLGGFILINNMMGRLEFTDRVLTHSAVMYMALSIGAPMILETYSRASGYRWARTLMATIYTAYFMLAVWIFPLFQAEPKLGPVYQRVTHMIPLGFPVLIIVPCVVMDLLWPKLNARWPDAGFGIKWLEAALIGSVFVLLLIAVEWPFGSFLMSPLASNGFFGTRYFAYMIPANAPEVRNVFVHFEDNAVQFSRNLVLAFVFATLFTRLGIMFGNWMRKVRR